jgi:cytochrome c oxidase cbb3-type subunit 3
MADFVSPFWSWFVAITTLVGIVGLYLLASRLSSRRPAGSSAEETSGHVWDEDLREYNNPLPRWWLNLFYLTLVWGVLYLAAFPGLGALKGFMGWNQRSAYEAEVAAADAKYAPLFERLAATDLAELARDPQAMQVGARLFSNYCATCHGSDARGARGFPNLRDHDWLYGAEPAAIKISILQGRQAVMPAWGAILSAEAQADVGRYVEHLAGRKVDEATVTRGASVYATNCAACHGTEGKGNPLMGAPNLSDDVWLYGGSPERIAESIAKGRQGKMPAHETILGEARSHVLAAYVLSIGNEGAAGVTPAAD